MNLTVKNQDELFALPKENWLLINRLVGELITTGKLEYGEKPNSFPPAFVDTVNLSEEWTRTTFGQIEQLAEEIVRYALQARDNWQVINRQLAEVPRGGLIPPSLQTAVDNELTQLKGATDQICRQITPIDQAVITLQSSFIQTATQWKSNQRKYQGFCDVVASAEYLPIPPGASNNSMCRTILAIPMALVHLLDALKGAWQGLSKDLSCVVSHPFDIDLPFVMSLNIANAINDWQRIINRAEGFPQVTKEAMAFWHIPDNGMPWKVAATTN